MSPNGHDGYYVVLINNCIVHKWVLDLRYDEIYVTK